jgi:queuine/archaeosine tRNA-ribosyltransferase
MKFTLEHTDPASRARAGVITTDHGEIQTPIFMPVGTAATVKGIFHRDLKEDVKAQIILANTYHLYLRPGMEVIEAAGGVHRFSTWDRPMLTDSGGFQVFSLAARRKITEEGVRFSSHIDGSKHIFTPENVIDTERTIGADIMMAFDECPDGRSDYRYSKRSLEMTQRWLDRCFNQYERTQPKYGYYQSLFPIVQGCTYPDLRASAAEFVKQYDADGYAIGGLAVLNSEGSAGIHIADKRADTGEVLRIFLHEEVCDLNVGEEHILAADSRCENTQRVLAGYVGSAGVTIIQRQVLDRGVVAKTAEQTLIASTDALQVDTRNGVSLSVKGALELVVRA